MRVQASLAVATLLLALACTKKAADPVVPGPPGAVTTSGAGGEATTGAPGGGAGGAGTGAGGSAGAAAGAGGTTGTTATAAGPACGPKTCLAGQVCCNPSCGICTPPDGVCTQQLCESADAAGGATACRQDGDCRLFSDYCTGCDCRALLKSDRDPVCTGPGVRCFADPCRDKTAACQKGACIVAPRPASR